MKYSLVALSFAALALASCATGWPGPTEQLKFDRNLPSSPELEPSGSRQYAKVKPEIAIRIQPS
jgi:hypothetical protein